MAFRIQSIFRLRKNLAMHAKKKEKSFVNWNLFPKNVGTTWYLPVVLLIPSSISCMSVQSIDVSGGRGIMFVEQRLWDTEID